MNCGAYVQDAVRHKKGSGDEVRYVKLIASAAQGAMTLRLYTSHTMPPHLAALHGAITEMATRRCDGRIVATVAAVDEPYFGGTSSILEVTYKCEACGNTHFPDLPTDGDAVSAALTAHVVTLPQPEDA
jgi:hypothetical protein